MSKYVNYCQVHTRDEKYENTRSFTDEILTLNSLMVHVLVFNNMCYSLFLNVTIYYGVYTCNN